MSQRISGAVKLLAVLFVCYLLTGAPLKGALLFAILMGAAWIRGRLWGVGGHIRWGNPKAQYETGMCAPGCPACIKHSTERGLAS